MKASIPSREDSYLVERTLVEDWKAGKNPQESFRRLFELYATPVRSFFRRRGFSAEDSEDLTQETFLGALRGIDGFRSDSSFKTWLFSIAANTGRNHRRAHHTDKRKGEEVPVQEVANVTMRGSPDQPFHAGEDGPLREVLIEERLSSLYDALTKLSPNEQRCLMLRISMGLKYREIALVLRIPMGSVKSMLSRARQRLRKKLAHRYPDIEV